MGIRGRRSGQAAHQVPEPIAQGARVFEALRLGQHRHPLAEGINHGSAVADEESGGSLDVHGIQMCIRDRA